MITVLGASGFIGSHLVKRLQQQNAEFQAIGREGKIPLSNLGDVIYCIGVTADFRSKPFETVDAHVCTLLEFVRTCRFDSLLYLSSTRLYTNGDSTNEDQPLCATPQNLSDLYNISKLMGESIALHCGSKGRVARIANVYGPDLMSDNFLPSVLRQAVKRETVVLQGAPDSEKDYVGVDVVVDGLLQIGTAGKQQIYNLGSGVNVPHRQLAEKLQLLTGCQIEFAPDAPTIKYPQIDIQRMKSEFDYAPSSVLDDLPRLVELYEEK